MTGGLPADMGMLPGAPRPCWELAEGVEPASLPLLAPATAWALPAQ